MCLYFFRTEEEMKSWKKAPHLHEHFNIVFLQQCHRITFWVPQRTFQCAVLQRTIILFMWSTFKKSKEPFEVPWILKVLHGTIDANKEPFIIRAMPPGLEPEQHFGCLQKRACSFDRSSGQRNPHLIQHQRHRCLPVCTHVTLVWHPTLLCLFELSHPISANKWLGKDEQTWCIQSFLVPSLTLSSPWKSPKEHNPC